MIHISSRHRSNAIAFRSSLFNGAGCSELRKIA
jgi:hypothetical protein